MDRQAYSDLVGAIYDVTLDAERWPNTLGKICEVLGFRKATVDLNLVPGMMNLLSFHHGIDQREASAMISNYAGMPEVWGGLAAVMARPIDRVWVVSRLVRQDALVQASYYTNWVKPTGLIDGAAIVLSRDRGMFGSLRLATDTRRGFIDNRLIKALDALLPHCQRAARIHGMLAHAGNAATNFQAVTDALSAPVILLATDCAIVHLNPAAHAFLEDGGILTCVNGRLVSSVAAVQKFLCRAIRQLSDRETGTPDNAIDLSIRLPAQAAPALHLLPLGAPSNPLKSRLGGDAVAALFIASATASHMLARDRLKAAFGLTTAELNVLACIHAGKATQEIAAELGIAVSTVRTHVLHLFQKTDTHCRIELIRLSNDLAKPAV